MNCRINIKLLMSLENKEILIFFNLNMKIILLNSKKLFGNDFSVKLL
jgi:hypothetical protein